VDAAIERGRRQNKKYGKKEHQREGSAEEGHYKEKIGGEKGKKWKRDI